jgi:PAS domain S-box-containing protein
MAEQASTTVLLDYTQDKVAVVDADGTFKYVNDAAERILGFESKTLVGTNAWEYVHPEDRPEVRRMFEQVVDSDEYSEITGTYRHERADGGWAWLESRLSNLTEEALGGYVVSSRDVTDRVEAENRRDESELRLREIAEKTSEVLWVFDADWSELVFCNTKCEEVYGIPVSELEGDPTRFLDAIHPEDVPAVRDAMGRLSEGDPVDMEYRVNPDTEYSNWVWVQGEPVIEDGEVVRIVGFARDITDRRRRERQLAVMDNLLRHNLRNDMNAIIANAELIEDEPTENPAGRAAVIRRVGEQLVESAEKQRQIIELLQDPECPQSLSLPRVAEDAVTTLEKRYPEITIHTDFESARARALPQSELAVFELLDNAIRHATTPAPTVTVRTRVTDDAAELIVEDSCPPIPEDEYRVLTGEKEMTATYHSSGLGLWLVYWVVDLSDGEIEFARDGDGNVATVRLPLA